jgi:hypothetical protein
MPPLTSRKNWTAVSWIIPALTRSRRTRGAMKRSKFSEGQIVYILRQASPGGTMVMGNVRIIGEQLV